MKKDIFSSLTISILMIACMLSVANIYYDQVLLVSIAQSLQITNSQVGLLITFIQVGYTLALLFIVPLGDFFNRRKLILIGISLSALFLIMMSLMNNFYFLLISGFCLGICTVSAQIIIPFVSSNTDEKSRSKYVGRLLTGVFLGVLFGRVFGGFMGQLLGWKYVHIIAAIVAILEAITLYFVLPQDTTKKEKSYKTVLLSMIPVLKKEKLLHETIFFGMAGFCIFNIFWVSLAFILEDTPYNFGSAAIGLFGLVGVAGTIVAGFSAKLADSKKVNLWNLLAMSLMGISFISLNLGWKNLFILVIITFVLDIASRMNTTINQARNYQLSKENHSRISSLYMFFYYLGGALGSFLGSNIFDYYGIGGITIAGLILVTMTICYSVYKRLFT